MSFSEHSSVPDSERASRRRAWICGARTRTASNIGLRNCRIVYDKFHVLQHANKAIDEVRRAEFFRKGGRMRGVVKGKRWLPLTRWMNLDKQKRQQLNELFALNRRVMKAYLLKESLERLWTYAMKEPCCAT